MTPPVRSITPPSRVARGRANLMAGVLAWAVFAPNAYAASSMVSGTFGDGVHDDGPAVASALARQLVVELPAGTFLVSRTLVVRAGAQLRGAGTGVTVLRLAPGSNQDLMQTEHFEELRGTARIAEAPADISISGLSLDGGFLSTRWNDPMRRVLNSHGSCLELYAIRVRLDIEINNCADHMLYSEGQGLRGAREVASTYRVQGLVAGAECVVFRGPGDSRFERLSVGVCGAKRQQPALSHEQSALYPSEPGFDGIVIDRLPPYEGTLEIGFAHIFASFSGWGVRTRGSSRFHAEHLVSESNLGGVFIDKATWGAICLLDIHSNGASVGALTPGAREALLLQSAKGFSIAQGTIARTAGSAEGFLAARITGSGSNVTLTLLNTQDPATKQDFRGPGVVLSGSSNIVRITAARMPDEALVITGDDNLAQVSTNGVVRNVGQRNVIEGNSVATQPAVDESSATQRPDRQ